MADSNTLKADLTWVEGMQFVGRGSNSGVAMVFDSSAPEEGRGRSGASPMEALLLSLAACSSMDVISILKKKQQRVTGMRVNLNGLRAEEHPRRYTHIDVEFVVRGYGIEEKAVDRSIELSRTKYCSVAGTLNAEISYSFRIEEETPMVP